MFVGVMAKEKIKKADRHPLSQLDPAVLQPLNASMKVEIVVNNESDVWILHDGSFSDLVKWAEYDDKNNRVLLVMTSGRSQDIGIVIPKKMQEFLQGARQIFLMHVEKDDIRDFNMVPLIVHNYTFH